MWYFPIEQLWFVYMSPESPYPGHTAFDRLFPLSVLLRCSSLCKALLSRLPRSAVFPFADSVSCFVENNSQQTRGQIF